LRWIALKSNRTAVGFAVGTTQLELRRKLIEHDRTIKELDPARIDIAAEKAWAEELLDNLLPAAIADELKRYGKVQPKYSRSATILFADFQGFTLLGERTEPAAVLPVRSCARSCEGPRGCRILMPARVLRAIDGLFERLLMRPSSHHVGQDRR
jgi:hypothetical protein